MALFSGTKIRYFIFIEDKYEIKWDITDNTGKSINSGTKELEMKNPYEKASLILSTIQ